MPTKIEADKIPSTTTLEVKDGVLHWTNTDFFISVEEAQEIKSRVEKRLGEIDAVLVDNAEASGTWPSEIDEIWGRLMRSIYAEGLPCATVAASATNAMHVNRLARDNDTADLIRAFRPDERSDALEFVAR